MINFYNSNEFISWSIISSIKIIHINYFFRLIRKNESEPTEVLDENSAYSVLRTPSYYALSKAELLIIKELIISSPKHGRIILFFQ